MKVKIGDTIHDSAEEPIMIILSKQDKVNINNMFPDKFKYASYPEAFEPQSDAWIADAPSQ